MKDDLSLYSASLLEVGPSSRSERKAVVLLGGDARQVAVIRALVGAGYTVCAAGLCGARGIPGSVRLCGSLSACLRAAEETGTPDTWFFLLPLPVSRDGETVHCPLDPTAHIKLSDVLDVMESVSGAHLLGGCLPSEFLASLTDHLGEKEVRERVVDYYTLETVQIPNARITAEAAVMTAMELTDITLLGSRMAIIGYGRIGQFLARLLLSLGASVTVCARREESLAFARGDGCTSLSMSDSTGRQGSPALLALAHGYDVIFNTVPAAVLDRQMLEETDPHTLILDLASAPGGVDPETAALFASGRGHGTLDDPAHVSGRCSPLPWSACLRIVRAPSLPGRYAPVTAGQVLADAILPLIAEGGDTV